jgi:hypothetical protein
MGMRLRKINPFWIKTGAIAAIVLLACAIPLLKILLPGVPPEAPVSSAPVIASPSGAPSSAQPESRVIPLSIEGQPVETELKLFDPATLPFTTYIPAQDFQSETGASGEGQGVRFYYSPTGKKDEAAYIHVFLPRSPSSVEEIRQIVLGDQGLMASNQWELGDRTDVVSYPWAKEKLTYQQQTPNGLAVGAIYIGENQGKAFYVLTHYPAEYTDGFEPRSAVILENLKFRE